ncbi:MULTISPECIES: hypothetical protein [unclassified Paracoccus (in: a-proteobacteria)]|uniref:hypothetical protein n=1 Tax=unclassified Paracoccus (in: a-proteobacteria) TaxID=2688777 RepID=UPI0012B38BDD|nr:MULTISPECIES: hypothetical protein [unclassified Paracoccus (in: a-proteobacteria)]UXU75765.1 hypothetical protein GB879_004570 [Paracoccus sp. SMMA_5]UXU81674.1 hypothetical protein GB880_004560 [Paracoccus sp. SMMA_5_TC]
MTAPPVLNVHLEGSMLETARAGTFNFMNVLRRTVEAAGWQLRWLGPGETATAGWSLFHMQPPPGAQGLIFRRAYHYPFWRIETQPQRWRFEVARQAFDPATVDGAAARDFSQALRARLWPGPPPRRGDLVLVPLQGHLRRCRSFQTMSPVEMLARVAETGRPVVATLHPRERLEPADHLALEALARRHGNLRIGGDSARLLRDCALVATQNSAVAFDGYLLGKPAVLFAQIDFHHIGLNVAELGARRALAMAPGHGPDFDRYLHWFLREQAIEATRPEAGARILAALRRGGLPI